MRQKWAYSSTSIRWAIRTPRLIFRESKSGASTKRSRWYSENIRTKRASWRTICTSGTSRWPSTSQCSSRPWFSYSWCFVAAGALRALSGERTRERTTSLDRTMARIASTSITFGRRSPPRKWLSRRQSHSTSTFGTPCLWKIQSWSSDSWTVTLLYFQIKLINQSEIKFTLTTILHKIL